MRNSIRTRLTVAFIGLAISPLLLVGIVLAWQSFTTQEQQALNLQREVAQRVSTQVTAFFEGLENELHLTSQVQGLQKLDQDKQHSVLSGLLSYHNVFDELALLDSKGQEQVHLSRTGLAPELRDRSKTDEFVTPQTSGQTYYSPVRFEEFTGEPLMTIAMPLLDVRTGQADGVLVSEVRIKKIWDLIANVQVSPGQSVYIVNAQGQVVAHRNPSVVLGGVTFHAPRQDGIQPGLASVDPTLGIDMRRDLPIHQALVAELTGLNTVLAVDTVRLGEQELNIIAEQTVAEALALAINTILITLGLIVVVLIVSVTLGFLIVRQIVGPIQTLATTAQAISAGDLSQQAAVTSRDEIGALAQAFNSMTTQLRELIAGLEQRVANRTRGLQTAAEVAGATTSVLDPDELMRQAVDLVRDRFDLYYVGLFLLDQEQRFAVLRAGTGEAGQQMMAQGHRLEVSGDSMVGQCVARGEARIALDAGEEAIRFDNPLLPDTRTEMALPLRSRGRTIGAMTVQSVEEAAFDEADMVVMQTMADQVAVAIDNAQLFAQTQAALEETARARESAEAANKALEAQMWQTAGQAQLSDKMRGEQDVPTLANGVIQQLCQYLKAQIGALYITADNSLNLLGSYAYASKNPAKYFKFGEGLVGQTALEKQPIIVTDVPEDCITTRSALGEIVPRHIMLCPFTYEDRVVGVVEMGTLTEFSPAQMDFVQTAMTNIAIAFNTAQSRARIVELLAETQQQAEELQAQEEELRVANEELEAQTESLRASETKLKGKQAALDRQNRELKVAQQELEKKAEELALTSKYKSEFLANMSHELRTPLNSLLILARMLADNEEGNLTEEQVESAQIIHGSGNDLLNLINDILDLSKVESGRMTFNIEAMLLTDLVATVRSQFTYVAEEKGLDLNITLADDLPASIETDQQRVKQIVKNLLSNAFKFTSIGSVSLNIYRPGAGVDLSRSGLDPSQAIAIRVTDTGIGIAPEQQKIVFEAFQQADGSTNRQYGGTGLGLSISRELTARLGGQISLESEPGQGSTFTLYLPERSRKEAVGSKEGEAREVKDEARIRRDRQVPGSRPLPPATQPPAPTPYSLLPTPIPDDRGDLNEGDKILLIIEDDPKFTKIVYDYAHEKAFKCLIAGDGKTGLGLVKTYQPTAIILDLNLPDISGWQVLEVLKHDPGTRHISVHIMSVDEETLDAYRKGAMGYLTKPVSREGLAESFQRIEQFISREIKALLLVEDDAKSRRSIKKLLGGSDVQISEADRGQTALELLKVQHFDCMILDLNLPDMTGFEVLSKMNDDGDIARCPVIVYTGRDLTAEENLELMKYAESVIVKGVKSPERLLDETALFLHRVVADMPEDKQQTIKQLYNKDGQLGGKKILIVDDDMRSSFALSKVLSDKGIVAKIAQNGQKALELLAESPDIDLVLMDIMMPVMDGYETIGRIRARREFRALPILALTAKAMKGDREKCLAAGANDYLPKPVDVDRLFSMLRVWLYQ